MEFTQYIKPEMLVLVPVLWLIGNALKRTPKVPDRLIPYVLGIMGVAGCSVWVCATRNVFSERSAVFLPSCNSWGV